MADSPDSSHSKGASAPTSCDFCREKKYRCSKDRPSCAKCLVAGRACHYSPREIRSPLTRIYVTSLENRVKDLEALLQRLSPGINIEEALETNDLQPAFTNSSTFENITESNASENVQNEALPLGATGFEWQEVNPLVDELADGMASLSVDVSNRGYLGSTSGAGLLRSLISQSNTAGVAATSTSIGQPVTPFSPNDTQMNFQLGEQLLNHQIINYLIDSYFVNYHTTYPFIHEPSFRAAYSELLPRPAEPVWQIFFYTVLTLGAWTVGGDSEVFDDWCYHKAVEHFQQQSIFELGSLPLVQALTLLSNYVQKRNKPNTGSNYLGLAVRQSLSLGLHRELAGWKIGLLEREMRRRVWWGLFIFDSGASTTFGRHILLPEDDDVGPVTNVPDEVLTPSTTILPPESTGPTIYTSLIHQSRFHRITNSMANKLLAANAPSAKETLQMHESIQLFRQSLPHYFEVEKPPVMAADWYLFGRVKLAWRTWNFELLAMRPFLLRWAKTNSRETTSYQDPSEEAQCRQLCIDCAHATITSINQYVVVTTPLPRLHAWYALFFLFHATLVPMLCLRASPESLDAATWIQDVNTAKLLLETAFTGYALANRCLDVINQLLPFGNLGSGGDWSPAQLDLSFSDSTLETWFDWSNMNSASMPASDGLFSR